jgi:6-phosphogluconolactonase
MSGWEGPGERAVVPDAAALSADAAARIAAALGAALSDRGAATLALSGGGTPRDAYARLARETGLDWGRIDVFWVDERAVVPTDDRSNYHWAKVTLLDAAAVPPARVHRMPAERPDADAAAREYEELLLEVAGAGPGGVPVIDVAVLGIGDDGHTASLFPGEPTVDVRDRLVVAVPPGPGREARMTLTAPVLEAVRRSFVLVTGASKRDALRRVFQPDGDRKTTPARVLRDCRGPVVWLLDAAAGA